MSAKIRRTGVQRRLKLHWGLSGEQSKLHSPRSACNLSINWITYGRPSAGGVSRHRSILPEWAGDLFAGHHASASFLPQCHKSSFRQQPPLYLQVTLTSIDSTIQDWKENIKFHNWWRGCEEEKKETTKNKTKKKTMARGTSRQERLQASPQNAGSTCRTYCARRDPNKKITVQRQNVGKTQFCYSALHFHHLLPTACSSKI